MLDIFNNDAWGIVRLTARINDLPYVPGQISRQGYFQEDGVDVLQIAVERDNHTLRLVGPTPRGGPGEVRAHDEGNMRLLAIPHFQREDSVLADEVQGRRVFGGDTEQLETVLARVDRKVAVHLRDFDMTMEHQRIGAIKGIVTNKKGGVMYNLYQEFDVTPPTPIAMNLQLETTDLQAKGREIQYKIEDALDAPYEGIDAWVGRGFFEKLVSHKSNIEAYKWLADRDRLLGNPDPDVFEAHGITWRRYRTGMKAQVANGGVGFIGENECRFVVRGVPDLFLTRFGPADYMETVNTQGLPRYLKSIPRRDDKGVDLQIQTNPINICTRPDILFSAVPGAS